MLTQFRHCYPQGSLVSELIDIDSGLYLVKVSIEVEGIILATGLAGENTIELAEDSARNRAIAALVLETRGQGDKGDKGDKGNKGDKETRGQGRLGDKNVAPVVKTQPQPTPEPTPVIQPPQPIVEPTPTPQPVAAVASEPIPANNNVASEVMVQPETQAPQETQEYQRNIFDQPIVEDTPPPEPLSEEVASSSPSEQLDFNEIRHKIDLEMKRLSWTKEQGRDYLLSTYGKRSRLHLLDDELLEFLHYLENLA